MILNRENGVIRIFSGAILAAMLFAFSATSVSAQNIPNNNSVIPVATTNPANSITNRSADLNSIITNSGVDSYGTNTWFEWGTSGRLDHKTQTVTVRTLPAFRHTDTITDLVPGMTYYFRVVAENSYYRSTGDILNFTTNLDLQAFNIQNGASVIGAGSFFPTTVLGWIILVILMLILLVLVKHLYRDKKVVPAHDHAEEHVEIHDGSHVEPPAKDAHH